MMADYTDSGILFRNEHKTEGDNRPDYEGKINVGGTERRLAAWIKTARTGKKFMSLKVSDFRPQQDSSEAYRDAAQPSRPPKDPVHEPLKMATDADDLDESIPF